MDKKHIRDLFREKVKSEETLEGEHNIPTTYTPDETVTQNSVKMIIAEHAACEGVSSAADKKEAEISIVEERNQELVIQSNPPASSFGLDLGPNITPQKIGEKIKNLLERQLNLAGEADIHEVEKLRSERQGLLEILTSLAEFKHIGEILQNSEHQFKRKEEIEILQNQLDAYKRMSTGAINKLNFLEGKLSGLYETHNTLETSIMELKDQDTYSAVMESKLRDKKLAVEQSIAYYQDQLDMAFSTIRKSTSGISELIKTERLSGNRGWQSEAGGGGRQVMMNLGGGKKPEKSGGGSVGKLKQSGPEAVSEQVLENLENVETEEYTGEQYVGKK